MGYPYSSGDVLTAADLNGSFGMVHVGTYTATDDALLDIDSVFTSQFDSYRMIVTFTRADGDIFVRFRSGGVTSTTGYQAVITGLSSKGSAVNDAWSDFNEAYVTVTNFPSDVFRTAITCDVLRPYANSFTVITGTGTSYNTGGNYWHYNFGVTHSVTGQRDGIRIDTNGALLSCKALVYGYNEG
jgi:hypothetical protein